MKMRPEGEGLSKYKISFESHNHGERKGRCQVCRLSRVSRPNYPQLTQLTRLLPFLVPRRSVFYFGLTFFKKIDVSQQ